MQKLLYTKLSSFLLRRLSKIPSTTYDSWKTPSRTRAYLDQYHKSFLMRLIDVQHALRNWYKNSSLCWNYRMGIFFIEQTFFFVIIHTHKYIKKNLNEIANSYVVYCKLTLKCKLLAVHLTRKLQKELTGRYIKISSSYNVHSVIKKKI